MYGPNLSFKLKPMPSRTSRPLSLNSLIWAPNRGSPRPLTIAVGAHCQRLLRKKWLVCDGKPVQARLEEKDTSAGWQYRGV